MYAAYSVYAFDFIQSAFVALVFSLVRNKFQVYLLIVLRIVSVAYLLIVRPFASRIAVISTTAIHIVELCLFASAAFLLEIPSAGANAAILGECCIYVDYDVRNSE